MIDRYQPLKTCYSEKPVMLIDTAASHSDLLDAADQRLRAASDLLETLYCMCFKQADAKIYRISSMRFIYWCKMAATCCKLPNFNLNNSTSIKNHKPGYNPALY